MSTGTDHRTRALAFLAARQEPSGRFKVLMGRDLDDPTVDADDDPTPFATALIVQSLEHAAEQDPGARAMIERALPYLRGLMEPGGVWRYWPPGHPQRRAIPIDLDDTVCISQVLRRHGVAIPDNRRLLLASRSREGLFHTWVTPRWRPAPRSAAFWRIALQRYLFPVHARLFWKLTESERYDVDGVVNANVLHYLGESPETAAVIDHLVGVIRRGEEATCDKWHLNAFTLHYMVARCHEAGATGLGVVRDEAIARIRSFAQPDGLIGATPLDTALAVCALASWGAIDETAARGADWLRATQREDGSWPTVPMYWGGPIKYYGWGSEELTTGYALEAIVRCPA